MALMTFLDTSIGYEKYKLYCNRIIVLNLVCAEKSYNNRFLQKVAC